jgi:hypothetical protein
LVQQSETDKSRLIKVGDYVNMQYGISRIVPLVTAYRMKSFGKFSFPFFCLPIKNRDKALGVLGIDTFDRVEHARQITPPTKNGHAPPPIESRKSSQSVNPHYVWTWYVFPC